MKINIQIYNDSSYKYLPKKKLIEVVENVFRHEKKGTDILLNIIYINDEKIWEINRKYLKHNRTTDVITFSLDEEEKIIEGEIYISVDTAKKQSDEYKVTFNNEIMRLAVHGALHLAGYDDDTDKNRILMHNLENKYLEMI
ncbi:MAG: rRNA maturation RNase YbeY [bacterium]